MFSWAEAFADTLDHWQWRNPLPQGNTLNAVAYGNNLFVAVGGNGTIITSPDGFAWTIRSSGTINDLYAITYNNNTFVAVGQAGAVVTSSDGIHWIGRVSGTTNDLKGVIYGNSKFVTVGNSGTILTSSNGQSWKTQSSGTTGNLYCVAYGNGTFAVGGEYTLTSSDGVTWSVKSTTSPLGYYRIRSIIYYNNAFIASATEILGAGWIINPPSSYIISSTDGITWSVNTSFRSTVVRGLIYGSDKYVGAGFGGNGGYGATFTSSNGTTWSEQSCSTCGFGNLLNGVAYGNNTYIAVGYQGIIRVSSDGLTWNDGGSMYLRHDARLNKIIYVDSAFIAVGGSWMNPNIIYEDLGPMESGYIPIITSTDGSAWTARSSGIAENSFYDVAYGSSTYVVVGGNGLILSSTDRVNWIVRTSGTDYQIYNVVYGNGRFVAVANGSTVHTSPDGINWTMTTPANIILPNDMVYGGGLFVAVGYGGAIVTSPDGITWTKRVSGTTEELKGISYGESMFVSVGNAGAILTSPDGLTWTTRTSGTTNDLTGVAFGNSTFVVVGAIGTLLTSYDGITWVLRKPLVKLNLYERYRIAFGDSTFVVTGGGSNILQSARNNTIPSQFTFTDQTGVALGTVITSNTITVSGIDVAVPISITDGTYSINGGSYTGADGTVNNGDTVTVQLTSSGSYSTAANATLFIGEVYKYSTFNVTTQAAPDDGGSDGGGGCFIATAAFGSPTERHVQILRDFRDKCLLKFQLGQEFVKLYYRISPPIADAIAKNEVLRMITRWSLIPVIGVAYLIVMFGIIPTLLILAISFLMLISFVFQLRKRFKYELYRSSAR
jgi:hypothetical protein